MGSNINTELYNRIVQPILNNFVSWIQNNSILVIGILITTIGLILTLYQLRVYLKQGSTDKQLLLWTMVLITGISTIIFGDFVFDLYNRNVQPILNNIVSWLQSNSILVIGITITIIGLILTLSELRVYLKHGSTDEQLLLWTMVLITGLSTSIFGDFVFGLLLGISILMIVETIKMWDTPVWGQLMAATTASYLVILFGKIGQMVYDYIVQPENPDDQIFSLGFNIAFYVFIAVAFYFFGKKFILVSRFSSPQMVYLFLFGVLYVFIARFFPRDSNDLLASFNYLGIDQSWREYVIFADFGTYESLALVMVFMYFISGPLLTFLMGVEEVTDPEILEKVRKVAERMGINDKVKVGYVKAPILNAFAYGPWFDKRIAFISDDINDFTDSDIRGIVGHELAHAANHHVLWLLLLSIGELAIKKGLGLPATTLDYTLIPDTAVLKLGFAGYYVFSYGLLIILLVFVRILEGHADKKTKEAGYSKDLSQALYRLEGFYNGVASDFGISVNLLTDRKYSIQEKRRFTAQAARNLYSEVLTPSRGSAFANLFQSHPRTSYRIASLVDEDLNPMKAAFLPYRLMGFFMRKGAIKELNSIKDPFHEVIDETYQNDYGEDALEEVLKFNPWKEPFFELLDKELIGYNKFENEIYVGTFTEIASTDRVTSPVSAKIGDDKIDLTTTLIKEYYPDEKYVLKDGSIVTLIGYEHDTKEGLKLKIVTNNGKEKSIGITELGKPINYLKSMEGDSVLTFENGMTKLTTLDKIDIDESYLEGTVSLNGTEYKGKDLIISFPPLGFEFRKDRKEQQIPILKHLINKKSLIYTKENFDVSLSGKIIEVNEEELKFEDADGIHEIKFDRLEYIMFTEHSAEFIVREHISLFTKFSVWWSNRNEFNYIL